MGMAFDLDPQRWAKFCQIRKGKGMNRAIECALLVNS